MAMAKAQPKPVTEITVFEKVSKAKDEYSKKAQKAASEFLTKADIKAKALKGDAVVLLKNPQFQTISISTGAGAIILGTAGGAFGLASGVVVGGTVGVVPALLTFGLSIPAGAALGGSIGMCSGALVGGAAGSVGGGSAGYFGYKYRVEIKDGLIYVKTTAAKKTKETQIQIMGVVDGTKVKVKTFVATTKAEAIKAAKITQAKVEVLLKKPLALAKDPKVRMTTAGAAAGTFTGGAVGGSCGTLVGAAVGVVPALFTFGLSIPVGAAIGGAVGAVGGGSVGAVGGGAAGYFGYTYRKELGEGKAKAWQKVLTSSDYVKSKAKDSKDYVESLINKSGTGGTA